MSAISASVMSDNSKINTRSNNLRPSIIDSSSAISGLTPMQNNMLIKNHSDERVSEQSQGSKVILSAIVKKDAEPILTSNHSVKNFTTKSTPKELLAVKE